MPHADREERLEYLRQYRQVHRPSPAPREQGAGLPPLGHIAVSDDGAKIQCHVCGRWLGALPSHIARQHGLTAAEYKEAYGLARSASLWSPECQAKQREAAIARDQASAGRPFSANRQPEIDPSSRVQRLSTRSLRSASRVGRVRGRDELPPHDRGGNPGLR